MSDGYQVERRDRRNGPEMFIARDTRTPGPTGVGATEEEACINLEEALTRWRQVESVELEQLRRGPIPHPPGDDTS